MSPIDAKLMFCLTTPWIGLTIDNIHERTAISRGDFHTTSKRAPDPDRILVFFFFNTDNPKLEVYYNGFMTPNGTIKLYMKHNTDII